MSSQKRRAYLGSGEELEKQGHGSVASFFLQGAQISAHALMPCSLNNGMVPGNNGEKVQEEGAAGALR